MAITREDVLHIAKLAHLSLEPSETERMIEDLSRILDYVAQLEALDTRDVPPTTHVAVAQAPLRRDDVKPSLPATLALAEAPRASADNFLVPGFVEG